MTNLLKKIPASLKGDPIVRIEKCRVCGEQAATRIALVDFWDIRTSGIVRCGKCRHIQLDPMLTDEETAKGCYAYYIEESLRTSPGEQKRNYIRNFRRGVLFGYELKKRNINPGSVLEAGPGSGYFAAGLQYVFPGAEITVMDINQDILDFNQQQHAFRTIRAIPDNFLEEWSGMFDLVIARDILEHVSDISKVISNLGKYLRPGGHFHFITPNGHEDVWKHYLAYQFSGSASELLINHVNYFDGECLKNLFIQHGMRPVDYHTFGFKTTMKGAGWRQIRKLSAPLSEKRSADLYIRERINGLSRLEFRKKEILDQWYISKTRKWITRYYSWYQHFSLFRTLPENNVGHEIFGLFRKPE